MHTEGLTRVLLLLILSRENDLKKDDCVMMRTKVGHSFPKVVFHCCGFYGHSNNYPKVLIQSPLNTAMKFV